VSPRPAEEEFRPSVAADQVEDFADVLFAHLQGYVPVRILPEKGTPTAPPISDYVAADRQLGAKLTQMACRAEKLGRALYVVPATVADRGAAKAADIDQTLVVLIDLDEGNITAKRAHLQRHLGTPTLEVASGGTTSDCQTKLHLYWRLTEPAAGDDLDVVMSIRAGIAAAVGGDASFKSMHQPIRVAGSVHCKHGKRSPVRVLARSACEYDLREFAEQVKAMPVLANSAGKPGLAIAAVRPGAAELMKRVIRENGADGITRYEAIGIVAGHFIRLARRGTITVDAAWMKLKEFNAASILPPWPEDRLRLDHDRLFARDRANYPDAWAASEAAEQNGDVHAPEMSDDALAVAFVERFGEDWKYVPALGRWLHWSDTHWVEDHTGAASECVRTVCRAAAAGVEKAGEARRLASARTISAVERILICDPSLARKAEAFDRDPWALNTPAGILDLQTGEIREHDRDALMTRIVASSPGGTCPRWDQFLDEVTGGDADLSAYLQRIAGYCLSGSTSEQVFFFLHGQGANGKSVFLQVLAHVLGGHAVTAAAETFMSGQGDRHPTEIAGLRCARLVLVTETEASRSWAESRIKAITGGDRVRTRHLYRDFFEFVPTFKLIVAGNHRPNLTNIGEAMRRRLQLIPFEVTIPPGRRDKHLFERLKEEADGILQWMVRGCADWQERGLRPPKSVLIASDEYFADEDVVGEWISEQCVCGPEKSATAAALFASWKSFAEAGGHQVGSKRALGEALRARGCVPRQVGRGRGWAGISTRGAGDSR
jgi:P4 family phage/plasmid primase-like protien